MNRRGIALIAVLWVIAICGTLAATAVGAVRIEQAAARYRIAVIRGWWWSSGCLERRRHAIDQALREGHDDAWIAPAGATADCTLSAASALGDRIDINSAPDSALRAIPGLDSSAVDVVLRRRRTMQRIETFERLEALLGPQSRAMLSENFPQFAARTTFTADAWDVTGFAVVGGSSIAVVTERWVRAGNRVAVTRRRLW